MTKTIPPLPQVVVFGTAGRLVGHFYIHNADDSGFVCIRG
jgi:hypothetical protein